MPELPEVETVCRGLRPVLDGHRITRVTVRRTDLRQPLPPDFARRLEGQRVLGVGRRAKYILLSLDADLVLLIHLGMSGRLIIHERAGMPAVPGHFAHESGAGHAHEHVAFETDTGARVVFSDPRRFGLMALSAAATLDSHPLLKDLGPEPLGAGFTADMLGARLAGKKAPLKAALLDQHVVAGLGNIYVCEALFRAGLSPRRLARSLGGARTERLHAAIQAVLEDAIRAGGSSLRDYAKTDGSLGLFQHEFKVYGRAGERCSNADCGATIRRSVQGNRSSFHCPRCQR